MVARTSKATWIRCEVAANNRSLYAGFGDLATKSSGGRFLGLGLKTKPEDLAWRDGPSGGAVRVKEPGPEDTRRGRKACVGGKQGCGGCGLSRRNIRDYDKFAPEGYVSLRGSLVLRTPPLGL
ncbi:unnamed protein product [Urochloa humidicola]